VCLLMDMAANIHKLVESSTDCGFLYWSREIMSTCFALVYTQTREARSLQHVVSVFKDGIRLLKLGHAEEAVIESYEKELEDGIINVSSWSFALHNRFSRRWFIAFDVL
jgi:hypothetical protein